jgi:hypothetical protein
VQTVTSGSQYHLVKLREVELAFLWLDHVPWNTTQYCVHIRGNHLGPYLAHVFCRGHGRVLEFSAEHEEGLSIHDELFCCVMLLEVGYVWNGYHDEDVALVVRDFQFSCSAGSEQDSSLVKKGLRRFVYSSRTLVHCF